MLTLAIILIIIIILAAYFITKDYFWQKRILKKWKRESSPDILKLLEYAKKNSIRIIFSPLQEWEGSYEWVAYLSRTITISADKQKGEILPGDHFLQKIIFAHEICHLKQEKEYFEVKFSCKYSRGNPCLFLELANWKKTFLFLQKLNLLHDDEEKKKFWNFVHSKPKKEIFAACLQEAEDCSCPKAAELNKILKQFPT